MTTTITTEDLANVPDPAGATYVADWDNPADPAAGRYFRGTKRVIDRADDPYKGDLEVKSWGVQAREGDVRRYVDVTEGGYERLTFSGAVDARQFGEALIAAADEVHQMAGRDPGIA